MAGLCEGGNEPSGSLKAICAQHHVVHASSPPLLDDVTPAAGNHQEADVTGPGEMEEEAAATKIQASYRGFKARKDLQTANSAASKIQAGFRGYQVRKQMRENGDPRPEDGEGEGEAPLPAGEEEERSATKIQAGIRGYLVRKRRQEEREAAVKIQASFRGYKARRDVKALKEQKQTQDK
ncbi:hypothetical protein ANN_10320 [Periplaneta americana]|uniref:Uncharacterized protein n=1 Tax=Periplaneta americana TaxID=6978 RepID=A0ABQ8TSK4_PERAM|nr:hypothetical protein ANN_10320 [Periplaneta americana]